MNNQIIPTGGSVKGLTYRQSRELAKTEQSAILDAAVEVADHNVRSIKSELAHTERRRGIQQAEECGTAAVQSISRVIDVAIDAVGDNEFKSHHVSKIVNKTSNRLAELA